MINDKLKAQAIAQLRSGYEVDTVAEDLEIPKSLVEEWKNNLDGNNLVALEAATIAVQRVQNGEVMPANEEVLKDTLENTAIELARQAAIPGGWGDIAQAKAIELCSNAVSKLYATIVLKNNSSITVAPGEATGGLNSFTSKMKD